MALLIFALIRFLYHISILLGFCMLFGWAPCVGTQEFQRGGAGTKMVWWNAPQFYALDIGAI